MEAISHWEEAGSWLDKPRMCETIRSKETVGSLEKYSKTFGA